VLSSFDPEGLLKLLAERFEASTSQKLATADELGAVTQSRLGDRNSQKFPPGRERMKQPSRAA
jgi:hypothetical protein